MSKEGMGFTILLKQGAADKNAGQSSSQKASRTQSGEQPKAAPLGTRDQARSDQERGNVREAAEKEGIQSPHPPKVRAESVDDLLDYGRQWTGHPYLDLKLQERLGEVGAIKAIAQRTSSPLRAIDCSGFAQELLGYAGIDPAGDQTAEGLYKHFLKGHGRPLKTPEKGSIIFFEPASKPTQGVQAGRSITHVAFGTGGGKIIESLGSSGVGERALPPEGRHKYHIFMPNYKFGGNT